MVSIFEVQLGRELHSWLILAFFLFLENAVLLSPALHSVLEKFNASLIFSYLYK